MKKPMIALTPLVDRERHSFWMLPGYMDGIREAGGIPVMLPLDEDPATAARLAEVCDGFLFTGGDDVEPARYGAQTDPHTSCYSARDRMEEALWQAVLPRRKPVLGICRGIQLMNVLLGGTLYQDLETQYPSPVCHHQQPPYDRPVHSVRLLHGTPLQELLGDDQLRVNSYHHQAIHSLAPDLLPMAVSEDGLIEGVYHRRYPFLWGVQWHPEYSCHTDPVSRKMFRAFVAAAM